MISTIAATQQLPANGFCVLNQTGEQFLFAADAHDNGRWVKELAPGSMLCTPQFDHPANGFVSVFRSEFEQEGCSRLTSTGMTEELLAYADFDRCHWVSRSD